MGHRQRWVRILASVTCATTMAQLPVFLVGAAAPSMRHDLHFGAGRLGLAISAFWAAMAVGALVGAGLARRLGAQATVAIGVATAALSLLGLASAQAWIALLAFAALGGLASAITTPAGDMALFAVLPIDRRGVAYGIKQASLPAASLLAGAGVPVLVLTVGWRWAFVAGLLLAVPALGLAPHGRLRTSAIRSRNSRRATEVVPRLTDLIPVATAVALAMSGVSAMGAFYVVSAVNAGHSSRLAGLLLALGGVFGIAGRFVFSWRLGQLAYPYAVVAALMGFGGVGAILFAIDGQLALLVVGTVIAFGSGWGWNGLLTQTAVVSHPHATARASAYVMVGAAVGGVIGPTLFGQIVTHAGYSIAWLVCGAEFLSAAAVLATACGRRRIDLKLEVASG
ncbi:MAG: major facilitator superfamily 1 [Frankiales bacterium]|nr:major facilitator superfamily 1 [Frankiales bacterium]